MSRTSTTSSAVSRRVTSFLLGFRWLSLFLGLGLAWFNGHSQKLAYQAFDSAYLVSMLVFVYHVVASLLSVKAHSSRSLPALLVGGDILMGFLITFTFGVDYLLLGYTFPVLEAAYFFGSFNTAMIAIFVSVFQIPALFTLVFKIAGVDGDLARLRGESLVAGVLVTLVTAWNMTVIHSVRDESEGRVKQNQEDKNLLLEQLHINKKDIEALVNQLNAREEAARELERELKEARDDLDGTLRKLHEARRQVQSAQQLALRKESEWAATEQQLQEEVVAQLDVARAEAQTREALLGHVRRLSQHLHRDHLVMGMIECLNALLPSQTVLVFALERQDGREELLPDGGASPYLDFVRNLAIASGEGPVGYVAQEQVLLCIDNGQLPDNDELSTLFSNERSALAVPLIAEERTLGVIYLGRPQPNAFSEHDQNLIEQFTLLASPLFNTALIYHRTLTTGLYDESTGLYNAAYFDERLTEEVRRAHRYNRSISLFLVELTSFGRFVEQVGHAEGTRVVRDLADMLREHVRETDVVARLEEDQFAVLMVESDKSQAILISERIRGAFDMRTMNRRLAISISGGLAVLTAECKTRDELVARAGQALAEAKKKPGNQVVAAR